MDAGRFAEAARDFEQALAIRLFEIPNFQLFPKLALAYSRAGDKRAARLNLERGRIALSLLVGVYHCDETPTGYLLDEAGTPLEGPQASEIMRRMCGAIYEHIYTSSSLEGFVWRARLVEYYFTVAKEIEGR
jgi:hypothetical protein